MATLMTDKKWSEKYPDVGTGPVSTEPHISPAFFDLERERIFKRHWLNMGRVEEIPNSGDYFVRELVICNLSILVVRGKTRSCARSTTSARIAAIHSC